MWAEFDAAQARFNEATALYDATLAEREATPGWRMLRRARLWQRSSHIVYGEQAGALLAMKAAFAKVTQGA